MNFLLSAVMYRYLVPDIPILTGKYFIGHIKVIYASISCG